MAASMELASTWRERLRGLLGSRPKKGVIVLAPCRAIHTFGMRYCIDVAFIDKQGRVMGSVRALPPGKIMRCAGAYAAIERAARPDKRWLSPNDTVGLAALPYVDKASAIERNLS